MTLEVKIVGFDGPEHPAFEVDVPPRAVNKVKKIAEVPSTDPDLMGSYPLNPRQVALIADPAHLTIDPSKFSYVLEAYEKV